MTLDHAIFYQLYGARGAWLWVMASLTVVGSGWAMVPIAAACAHARTRAHALWLVGVLVLVAASVFSLKAVFGRMRPCSSLADVHALVFSAPTDPSFPSGHAAGAFAFAAYVSLEARTPLWLKATLFVFAGGIALSRVVLGVHFPSDVVAGAILGGVAGWLASLSRRSFSKKEWNGRDTKRIF